MIYRMSLLIMLSVLFNSCMVKRNLENICGEFICDQGIVNVNLGYQQFSYNYNGELSGWIKHEGYIYQKGKRIFLKEYNCNVNLESDVVVINEDLNLGDSTRIVLKMNDNNLTRLGGIINGNQLGVYNELSEGVTLKLNVNKKLEVKYPGCVNLNLMLSKDYIGKEIVIELFERQNFERESFITFFKVTKNGLIDNNGYTYRRIIN